MKVVRIISVVGRVQSSALCCNRLNVFAFKEEAIVDCNLQLNRWCITRYAG
jgi:hypothetical protein